MTPLVPSSISNISLIPGAAFTTRKNNCLTRCRILQKSTKQTLSVRQLVLPLSTSLGLFPRLRSCGLHHKPRIHIVLATGTDVAVEEPDSPVADKVSGEALGMPAAVEASDKTSLKADTISTPAQSKRSRPVRKSEMPLVKNEELVPGATFTGKVRSIQPFGAFVDFGAFTDGLVHVSRLSDSYVKDVGTVVSVGQEVKVRLVEANTETGRISLTMRESDEISKLNQPPADGDRTRPPRRSNQKSNQKRDDVKKTSKFVKGQDLEGTVKNLTRAGAFISLPEGEEGFLPTSEESVEGFGNIMGGSSLQASEEVSVRVLRITRGQVTLTMKREEDAGVLDSKLSQGTVHMATNPFLLAFRKNKDIAAFLDEREKEDNPTENSEMLISVPSAADEKLENNETSQEEVDVGASTVGSALAEISNKKEDPKSVVSDLLQSVDDAVQSIDEKAEVTSEIVVPEGTVSSVDKITEAAPATVELENDRESDNSIAKDEEQVQTLSAESEISSPAQVEPEKVEPNPDKNSIITSSNGQIDVLPSQEITSEGDALTEITEEDEDPKGVVSDALQSVDDIVQSIEEEAEVSSEILAPERSVASVEQITEAAPAMVEVENDGEPDDKIANDEAQIQTPSAESTITSPTQIEHEKVEPNSDMNSSITSSNDQIDVPPAQESTSEESEISEVVENQIDDSTIKGEMQIQTPPADGGNPSVTLVEDESVGPVPEQNGSVTNSNEQSTAPSLKESTTKAAISPFLVKQLREETGAGMMDCKRALSESGGDIVKAQEYLRKKGLASADKKASRATAEGRIGSYIHDSRIGVLIEVNCETDFVSRGDIFKELVDDLAMQVAACPQVQYLVTEDVPRETVEKEREIEMQKEDLLSKPEQIRSKIVEGRIKKRLEEVALLEQPYIKNDKIVVKDWVKQTIATIGENIRVKRFVRYNLGEGLEKKSQDFAAEVAAQTAAKPVPKPGKEQQHAAVDAKETDEKPPKATISAALVKQLREETGAGMMDCKKALSETGGNLEKAQEYLRKKGLSAADKKSSRLAAEGRVGSYIHDSRIGVLIEVNCETDFVGRSEQFKELVDDLAMQVVACPLVQYVSVEDIPESIVSKEKALEMQREDILSKPENIRERIVDGRVSKRLGELALSEQPFIKNDSVLVKDLVKQTVAALGENIKVRRFVRFTLGEESDAKTESEA